MVNGRTSGAMRQLARVFRDGTLAGLSDREILGRFADDRDEAAFEALLGRHGPMVRNVCRQTLRDPDDAEDAFQATFLALACKAGTLHVGDSLGPWLYRVASRVAARARADRRRRGDRERSGGALPDPEPAAGAEPDRGEIHRVVHEELGRLPERLRAPIVLCYLEGMTHERAAHQLRCPVGTVRSRMARARALLHGRIARRGLVTSSAALGALLASNGPASAVPPHISRSLVKVAAQLAAGTASLRGGAGVSASVAALLEGVLNVLRAKQLASSMAALAAVGIVATVAGLSVFSASGQTGEDQNLRPLLKPVPPISKESEKPAPQTIVKTYYVGDLLRAPKPVMRPGNGVTVGEQAWVDTTPLIDLITSTVAKGTWTIHDGARHEMADGRLVELPGSEAIPSKTVGHITPFFLSISLIVRHTAEVHDEVANLLRKLRRLLDSREHPGGVQGYDRDQEALGPTTPISQPQLPPPTPASPPDRNARIRRLLDELRREVERL